MPPRRLERLNHVRAFATLLFAVFVVAVGYGIALPVIPGIVARLAGTSDPVVIARHSALLTGIYLAAPLVVALPWARASRRIGRRRVMAMALVGLAVSFAGSMIEAGLPLVYAWRLLSGVFAAAIVPSALATLADREADRTRRARVFSWVGMASIIGFMVGPVLGGFAVALAERMAGESQWSGDALPFAIASALAVAGAITVHAFVPGGGNEAMLRGTQDFRTGRDARTEVWLLSFAAVSAAGLGVFEVGLTLRGRELAMTPVALGSMFTVCSLTMLLVQGAVFSPILKPRATRWLIPPAFAIMAVGLATVPRAGGYPAMLAEVGSVAAAAGLLTPVFTYWTSLAARTSQDIEFGRQNAAVAFGQALGSVGAGLLFGMAALPNAAFLVPAALLAAAAIASVRLPRALARLAQAGEPLPSSLPGDATG